MTSPYFCSSCLYGGTCIDGINSFHCACVPGYTGTNCQHRVGPCDSNPCLNDGRCVGQPPSFRCHCAYGFTGLRCESFIDWCRISQPCRNGGTCVQDVATANHYRCNCLAAWTGKNCDMSARSCEAAALLKGLGFV